MHIHQWFDATKAYFADYTHRALRHHAEGIFECERQLGVTFTNSDGKVCYTRYVAEQHVRSDCGGRIPSAKDWLSCIVPQRWMAHSYVVEGVADSPACEASAAAPVAQGQVSADLDADTDQKAVGEGGLAASPALAEDLGLEATKQDHDLSEAFAGDYVRQLPEQVAHLSEDLSAIRQVMVEEGIVSVHMRYDGVGDDGQLELDHYVQVRGGVRSVQVGPVPRTVTIRRRQARVMDPSTGEWVRTYIRSEMPFTDAVQYVLEHFLAESHPGWEQSDGSAGTYCLTQHSLGNEHTVRENTYTTDVFSLAPVAGAVSVPGGAGEAPAAQESPERPDLPQEDPTAGKETEDPKVSVHLLQVEGTGQIVTSTSVVEDHSKQHLIDEHGGAAVYGRTFVFHAWSPDPDTLTEIAVLLRDVVCVDGIGTYRASLTENHLDVYIGATDTLLRWLEEGLGVEPEQAGECWVTREAWEALHLADNPERAVEAQAEAARQLRAANEAARAAFVARGARGVEEAEAIDAQWEEVVQADNLLAGMRALVARFPDLRAVLKA